MSLEIVFFIVGPTASGKSELAADVAALCGAEIVSADAFQIYRGLPILTAQPDEATLRKVPHHLINSVPATEEMSAEKFRERAASAIEEINRRGKLALVVGGSGLYLEGVDAWSGAAAGNRFEVARGVKRSLPGRIERAARGGRSVRRGEGRSAEQAAGR